MLDRLLHRALETAPDRPIVESDGAWTTAAELERLASRLASGLAALGLEPGDRVALLLPNRLETVVCYLACFRMHLVVVPIDYEYHPLQVGYTLGHSGASILVVDHERVPGLEEAGVLGAVPRVVVVGDGSAAGSRRPFAALLGADRQLPAEAPHGDSPAVMIYTSGTTSRPQGGRPVARGAGHRRQEVPRPPHPHAGRRHPDCHVRVAAPRTPLPDPAHAPDRGKSQPAPALHGRKLRGRPATAARQDVLTLTPASLWQLMESAEFRSCDFSRLRLCLAGGDRVPTRLLEAFERLTGVAVTEQCGSTETGPYAMNPPFGRKKPGSVGLPAHGVQVAVVDEHGADVPTGTVGDVRVSGPGIMDGYWNESAMTRKTLHKGWVLTGDLGRFDEDGYLWFVGRRKDIIVRDGHKVAPLAVEAALSEHPAARQACVIGVPDAVFGELPHAYVILQPDVTAGPEELQAFVAGRLAEFMVPAEVHVIAAMPSKGPGKIDRELLRMRAITAALIERVPFFTNASSEFLRDVIPRLDARTFSPGEVVVHEGDVGDEMYFLTKEQVEVVQGGDQQRIAVLQPGSFFGELAILRDAPRAATIRALTDIEVYALRRDGVLQLARAHADFNRYLQAAAYAASAPPDAHAGDEKASLGLRRPTAR